MLSLTWPKLLLLWEQLRKFKSLFSDLTRGDLENFIRYVSSRDTLWLEVYKDRELVGVMAVEDLHCIIDAEAHVLLLDHDLSGKVPICKAAIGWLFDNFPLQRLTVEMPSKYYTAIRFVRNLGFVQEGKKRQAVLINGRWMDVFVLGMTRQEAYK